jgi:hypothetical protein
VASVTGSEQARTIRDRYEQWIDSGTRVVAPALLGYEIADTLHRYVVAEEMSADDRY